MTPLVGTLATTIVIDKQSADSNPITTCESCKCTDVHIWMLLHHTDLIEFLCRKCLRKTLDVLIR